MPFGSRHFAFALAMAVMALPAAAIVTGQFKGLLNQVKQSTQGYRSLDTGQQPAEQRHRRRPEGGAGQGHPRDQQPRPQRWLLEQQPRSASRCRASLNRPASWHASWGRGRRWVRSS